MPRCRRRGAFSPQLSNISTRSRGIPFINRKPSMNDSPAFASAPRHSISSTGAEGRFSNQVAKRGILRQRTPLPCAAALGPNAHQSAFSQYRMLCRHAIPGSDQLLISYRSYPDFASFSTTNSYCSASSSSGNRVTAPFRNFTVRGVLGS